MTPSISNNINPFGFNSFILIFDYPIILGKNSDFKHLINYRNNKKEEICFIYAANDFIEISLEMELKD